MSTRRRRMTARRWQIGALAFVAAAVLVILLLTIFRIRTLEVEGNSRYAAEQIQRDLMSGDYWSGNTLVFAWRYKSGEPDGKTPYLGQVKAKILSPSKVRLSVREKTLTGAILYGGKYVCFDQEGMVLEVNDTQYNDIPLITGVTMAEPVLYKALPLPTAALRNTILSVSRLVIETGLSCKSINFDEKQNITVDMGDIQVQLGQDEYLEEKIANLNTIYGRVEGKKGTLNMTAFTGRNENITFEEEETETEPVTERESAVPQSREGENNAQPSTEKTDNSNLNSSETFQCFDTYGNLHNDGRVVNGVVVDAYGNPIEGCTITEDGNVKDAYWNIITLQNPVRTGSTQSQNTQSQGQSSQNSNPLQTEAQQETQAQSQETTGLSAFQAFDSYGNLHNDAHVVGGQVVDAYGTPIPGCSVNSDGYVVDGYWNVIDPQTGTLAQ